MSHWLVVTTLSAMIKIYHAVTVRNRSDNIKQFIEALVKFLIVHIILKLK